MDKEFGRLRIRVLLDVVFEALGQVWFEGPGRLVRYSIW